MDVYVARQPIFNRKKKIYGYELLFRDGTSNAFPDLDGNTATSKLLSSSFFTMGIEQIAGGKKAFINFTQDLLERKVPTMFPRDKIMVEILEDVEPTPELVAACREIAGQGYELALDDFLYNTDLKPLIEICQVIKIDFRMTPMEQVAEYVENLSRYHVKFLAEKVETHDEFQKAVDMGFEYFQGYFFSKPQVLKSRDISPSKINMIQIMAEVNKEDFGFRELEKLISRDVSVSYKLMRYINSAYYRRIQEISSIHQAIVMLGERGIRHFISLIVMAKLASDKPTELLRTSIIRARFCELLGKDGNAELDVSELFTLGLFSLIDAILDDTMENLMSRLPLSAEIKQALVSREGRLADYLELVASYETGDWETFSRIVQGVRVNEEKIPEYYIDAVSWADTLAGL
ncbi:MAG: HDOD domain-containing protein [Deltaproteobacteria bacterium]|nr:HDOD domain-containing protein [Deltaproteobacteria bacterium]